MEKDELVTKLNTKSPYIDVVEWLAMTIVMSVGMGLATHYLVGIYVTVCMLAVAPTFFKNYKIITLNKNGCKVKLFFAEKEIPWENLKMRYFCSPYGYDKEVVMFGVEKCNKIYSREWERRMSKYPLEYFIIRFKGMYFGRGGDAMQLCYVDKQVFMQKMQEWGIVFETDQIIDETEFLDKKGRLRPRKPGVGWRMLAFVLWFVLAAFVIYLLIYEVDAGEIIIGFPFFVFFFIAYKMVSGLRSSKLWMKRDV